MTGSFRLTFLDRKILRFALIGVSPGRTNWPSTRLFVVFNSDVRGGIGGGSDDCDFSLTNDDFEDGGKNSEGDTTGGGLLLVLVPFVNRRPTGGLRNIIWNGPDGRRDEDETVDGGDGFIAANECTKRKEIHL
jgi:hypothetical protein